jgi:hypothetical protein
VKPKARRAFDLWSLAHILGGALLAIAGVAWWLAPILIVAFEIAEAGIRRLPLMRKGIFEDEAWRNIAGDVFTGLLGFTLAWWLVPQRLFT